MDALNKAHLDSGLGMSFGFAEAPRTADSVAVRSSSPRDSISSWMDSIVWDDDFNFRDRHVVFQVRGIIVV
jgi:hypothetical protein